MIPDENDEAAGAMTTLMSNEKRKLTLNNIANSQDAAGRLRSGSKRYSEPVVGGTAAAGGGGYQNPWGNSKSESIAAVQGRNKSSLPGSLRDLGRGLNRKQTVIICDTSTVVSEIL